MKIIQQVVAFDAADMTAESTFWSRLMGGKVEAEDDWHTIYVDGEPRIAVQLAPNHVAPEWPNGTPQQVHLDLWVDDIKTSHEEVMSFGATLLEATPDIDSREGFQVYADPAGHPFCLCWHSST